MKRSKADTKEKRYPDGLNYSRGLPYPWGRNACPEAVDELLTNLTYSYNTSTTSWGIESIRLC